MALQILPESKRFIAFLADIAMIMLAIIVDPLETCRAKNETTCSAFTCLVCVGIILG